MSSAMINSYYPQLGAEPKHLIGRSGGFQPEPITIVGVVGPGLQQATSKGGYQLHTFPLKYWRQVTATNVQPEPLVIFRPAPTATYHRDEVPPFSTIECTIIITNKEDRALFVSGKILDTPPTDLQELATSLAKPILFESSVFGTLELNREWNEFELKTTWQNTPIDVRLRPDSKDDYPTLDRIAATLWQDQFGWHQRLHDFVLAELLDLKNALWLDEEEGEEEVTAEAFRAELMLLSVAINPNGDIQFYLGAGDLFLGHDIEVYGHYKNGFSSAGLIG